MNYRQKQIFSIIKKFNDIRYLQLENVVVHKKGLMAKKTFQKELDGLVRMGLIEKTELERQHVRYSIKSKLQSIENPMEAIEQLYKEYDKSLDDLDKELKTFSDIEKLDSLFSIINHLSTLELSVYPLAHALGSTKFRMFLFQFALLKMRVFEIAKKHSVDKQTNLFILLNSRLQSETISTGFELSNQYFKKFMNKN